VLVYTAISKSFIQSDTLGETISGITCISQIRTGGVFLCNRKARRTKKALLKCEIGSKGEGRWSLHGARAGWRASNVRASGSPSATGSRVLASLQYNDDGNP
jgi:hypothetical protein